MALFFYSTLDLMSHSFSYRAYLDQASVTASFAIAFTERNEWRCSIGNYC